MPLAAVPASDTESAHAWDAVDQRGAGGAGAGRRRRWAPGDRRLAATLAFHWAGDADPATPIGRLVHTGAISDATVDALYRHLTALEQHGPQPQPDGGWTTEAVVRALLDSSAVHRPRRPVPGWTALRDERIAARIFR